MMSIQDETTYELMNMATALELCRLEIQEIEHIVSMFCGWQEMAGIGTTETLPDVLRRILGRNYQPTESDIIPLWKDGVQL